MTRLNLVPPAELADQHLMAEWREIKMVPRSLARSLQSALRNNDGDVYKARLAVLHKIPKEYTLGKGHVSFFYDKGAYLRERYDRLTRALHLRGYALSTGHALPPLHEGLPREFNHLYAPTPEALALVRARIAERLAARPGWYRWSLPAPPVVPVVMNGTKWVNA